MGVLAVTVDRSCLLEPSRDIVDPRMRLVVPAGGPRTVALTLDACSGGADMRIIETLVDLSIGATIFVTGLWLRANPHALSLLLGRPDLFALQNHGERHLPPVLGVRRVYGLQVAGTLEVVQREVDRGADALVAAGGVRPRWYRGAAALYSPAAIGTCEPADARERGGGGGWSGDVAAVGGGFRGPRRVADHASSLPSADKPPGGAFRLIGQPG
jgi:peptidoglycan/xylan/chitin deacetylase (PgdA/CDA1 family)